MCSSDLYVEIHNISLAVHFSQWNQSIQIQQKTHFQPVGLHRIQRAQHPVEPRQDAQMLLGKGKKLHLFHSMYAGDKLLATGESFLLHVSLETRRPCEPSEAVSAAMAKIAEAQAGLPYPEGAGSAIRAPK